MLSADRMPSQLSSLAARLRDRFEWGLTVPIAAPDLPTRLTVLRRLTNEAGLETSEAPSPSSPSGSTPTSASCAGP